MEASSIASKCLDLGRDGGDGKPSSDSSHAKGPRKFRGPFHYFDRLSSRPLR